MLCSQSLKPRTQTVPRSAACIPAPCATASVPEGSPSQPWPPQLSKAAAHLLHLQVLQLWSVQGAIQLHDVAVLRCIVRHDSSHLAIQFWPLVKIFKEHGSTT